MSEETKNPLIESFLKLHELTVGSIARAAAPKNNLQNQQSSAAVPAPVAKPVMSSPQSYAAAVGTKMTTGVSTPSSLSMGSGPLGAKTTGLGATSGEGYSERLKGIQKANPIATPGKLEGGSVLKMGSRGDDVKALQTKLGVTADGIFGPKTAAALKAKQGELGIEADSVYGRQTKSAFDRADAVSKLKSENPQGYKQYTGSSMAQNQITNSGVGSLRTGSSLGQNMITKSEPSSLKPATGPSSSSPSAADLDYVKRVNFISKLKNQKPRYSGGGDKELNDRYDVPTLGETKMPSKIIEAFMKLHSTNPTDLFAEAKKVKKLDAVGKEDEDIDNDGDKDKSDSYLHNRRKKIAAAMKEESETEKAKKNPMSHELDAGGDVVTPVIPSQKGMKPSVVKQTGKNSSEVYKQQKEEVEQLDEAAFKLTDAHKSAITKHLKNSLGKGKVTFHSEHGGHFATHSDGIQSTVHHIQMKNGKMTLSHFMTMDEEVEQIDELKVATLRSYRDGANWDVRGIRSGAESNDDFDRDAMMKRRRKGAVMSAKKLRGTAKVNATEEVEFSESELEHFAAILEALPVGPTPDGYDVKAFGSSTSRSGTLTDEAISEEERRRGRKPGVKVGAYGPRKSKEEREAAKAAKESGKTEKPVPSGNPSHPHPFHQIRASRADSQGNYNLTHELPSGKVLQAKVPARAAAEYSREYMKDGKKPREKEALTDAFVAKHFGVDKPKAKAGVSLPSMPAPKS